MASPTMGLTSPALPLTLRPSTVSFLMPLVPIALVVILNLRTGNAPWLWPFLAVVVPVGFAYRWRLRMVLDDAGVTITLWVTKQVLWSEIVRFEAASGWIGGTRVVTTQGVLRSVAPGGRFEGPASAAQIAELEAIRSAHQA